MIGANLISYQRQPWVPHAGFCKSVFTVHGGGGGGCTALCTVGKYMPCLGP